MPSEPSIIERQTLCIASAQPGVATHAGEYGFAAKLEQYYPVPESNLMERFINLKTELKKLEGELFWARLMEGLTDICHAQYGFVSKRILVDDQAVVVEMPPLGEPGSCLMGVAFYWNDGKSKKSMLRDYKYYAWSAPCAYMRYDKVFVIPENLSTFIPNNSNTLPFQPDAYLGVPLFAEGKCFAHFGMMWTKDGLAQLTGLSWTYLEMLMHSLEDLISERLLEGRGFAKTGLQSPVEAKVIPQAAITAAQSLKPYARSLSHELRTPMQGVVGMLDVMYATVQEQIEGNQNANLRRVFQLLRENIEVVQDSSKRAVEAADNVVQAYDFNMQIPDTPSLDVDSPLGATSSYFDARPSMTSGSKIVNPNKRRRSDDTVWSFGNPTKIRSTLKEADVPSSPHSTSRILHRSTLRLHETVTTPDGEPMTISLPTPNTILVPCDNETVVTPGSRQSCVRELIPVVIKDSLRLGGRPDSAISEPIPLGERIEVRTRSSDGRVSQKIVEWTVHPDVPIMVQVDERDLSKLISAVFLNAIKFTEKDGSITLHVRPSTTGRYMLITVVDTGVGIPEDFLPELFKPFSQEDDSLTRSREGLGLGLLVAKGVARKIGGDLTLIRTNVAGLNRGSEFEIRVPVDGSDVSSRAGTPVSTPFQKTPEMSIPRSFAPPLTLPPRSTATFSSLLETSPIEVTSPTELTVPTTGSSSKPLGLALSGMMTPPRRLSHTPKAPLYDRQLAEKHPLTFLVAEDNKINRKLLVNMLGKFGYKTVYEAFDGREAVRVYGELLKNNKGTEGRNGNGKKKNFKLAAPAVDVILMDLWMPEMDGYQATEKILEMSHLLHRNTTASESPLSSPPPIPIVLAVSADVTDTAIERATTIGMQGYMTKPYKLLDLQRLILEFCIRD